MRIFSCLIIVVCCFEYHATAQEVGNAGLIHNILVEGNVHIPQNQIHRALLQDMEFVLSSHPRAERDGFLRTLTQRVTAGYVANGFPEALITARTHEQQVKLIIVEGPHFRCGEVQILGAKVVQEQDLITWLTEEHLKLIALDATGEDKNKREMENGMWKIGKSVNFEDRRILGIKKSVEDFYETRNRKDIQVDVEIKRGANGLAQLVIRLVHEGGPATIGHVTISGLAKNNRAECDAIILVKEGDELNRGTTGLIEERLRQCGRFSEVTANLEKTTTPGRYDVIIKLVESNNIPPFGETLSPTAEAVLMGRNWVKQWMAQGEEDLIVNFKMNVFRLNLIISPRKGVMITINFGSEDNDDDQVTIWATPTDLTYVSGVTKRKITVKAENFLRPKFSLTAEKIKEPQPGKKDGSSFNFYVGFDTKKIVTDQTSFFDVRLDPAFFITYAYDQEYDLTLVDNVVSGVINKQRLKLVDASSGKLFPLTYNGEEGKDYWSYDFIIGAYDKLSQKIDAMPAMPENHAAALEYAMMVLLDDAEHLTKLLPEKNEKGNLVRKPVRTGVSIARSALPLLRLLIPTLLPEKKEAVAKPSPDEFWIPVPNNFGGDFSAIGAMFVAKAYGWVTNELPIDHWLPIFLRGTTSILLNKPDFVMSDLKQLTRNDGIGPLGSLVVGSGLKLVKPELSLVFAEIGNERLRLVDFLRDLQPFYYVIKKQWFADAQSPRIPPMLGEASDQTTVRIQRALDLLFTDMADDVAGKKAFDSLMTVLWEAGGAQRIQEWLALLSAQPTPATTPP